jgi:hypothetical protein
MVGAGYFYRVYSRAYEVVRDGGVLAALCHARKLAFISTKDSGDSPINAYKLCLPFCGYRETSPEGQLHVGVRSH